MLSIHDRGTPLCEHLTRRQWLQIGGLGALGLSLGNLTQARAVSPTAVGSFGKAKRCIVICLLGGPPQHETWDPKPDAPEEIRGPFRPIQTSLPGLHVSELMPRLAQHAHRFSVLRAVSTRDNAHSSSGYYMLTGVPHVPMGVENARVGAPNNWPSFAALVSKMKMKPEGMPASVVIPEHIWNDGNLPWPGQDAGFLGRSADPWLIPCQPHEPTFRSPGLTMPDDVPALRFDHRQTLLAQVNRHLDASAASSQFEGKYRQALDLMSAGGMRHAFDLNLETQSVRDRYGRFRFGQSLLLARRLVEAGMPLVQVNWTRLGPAAQFPNQGTWDTHARNAFSLKDHLMPMMDQCVSALIDDLAQRGLLEDTLVFWMGEFGRTPRHNGNAGRDHWGSVFSLALAGGGVRAGVVHGASDSIAAFPKDGMVRPEDIHATLFHFLGIDPHAEVRDPQNRPLNLTRGELIRAIV